MRQLTDDDWVAFKVEHANAFTTTEATTERKKMLEQLLVRSAAAPKFTIEQLAAFRKMVGSPQVDELIEVAWIVNTQSGVSIPKSPLSSAVLRRPGQSQS